MNMNEEKSWEEVYKESREKKIEPREYVKLLKAEGWLPYADKAGMWRPIPPTAA